MGRCGSLFSAETSPDAVEVTPMRGSHRGVTRGSAQSRRAHNWNRYRLTGRFIPHRKDSELSTFSRFCWGTEFPRLDLSPNVQVPVAMEHDAEAVALRRSLPGAAKGKRSVICGPFARVLEEAFIVDGRAFSEAWISPTPRLAHGIAPGGPAVLWSAGLL